MSEEDDVRRAIKLLEGVMRVEGVSKRGMDERLGKAPGYVAQVLSGRLELKFRHILAILHALEIEPRVFFRALYPDPGETEGSVRMIGRYFDELQRGGLTARPEPAPPVLHGDELERRIREAVEAVLDERERRRHGRSTGRQAGRRRAEAPPEPGADDAEAADSDDPEPLGQLALA